MTDFTKLIDWIMEAYPPDGMEWEDVYAWIADIKRDFDENGHYFPPNVKKELRDIWHDNVGEYREIFDETMTDGDYWNSLQSLDEEEFEEVKRNFPDEAQEAIDKRLFEK